MRDPSDFKMLGTQASLPILFYFIMYFPKIFWFGTVHKNIKRDLKQNIVNNFAVFFQLNRL
jgi:hypothetical protein